MPLRDHFHGPARKRWPWTSIHSTWIVEITRALNQRLPPQYRALPTIHLGGQGQVDVATVTDQAGLQGETANGSVATAVWAPPQPPIVVPAALADLDVFEIEVRNDDEGYRLVAAVELVSPANKDRLDHRNAFVSKCAAYLQHDVSVVVVDVVTERHESLHKQLMRLLNLDGVPAVEVSAELYAIAYRAVGQDGPPRLEMWPTALHLDGVLPVLPLWIAADQAVPVDLETTYVAACESLRLA
jgi:hypothetical protein